MWGGYPQGTPHRHAYQFAMFVFAHPVRILYAVDTINEEHAIQVIYLVMNHHRVEALENSIKGIARLIQAGYPQVVGAHGLRIEAGEAETAVEISLLVSGLYDFRVDQG
jgi:hypothetical protein